MGKEIFEVIADRQARGESNPNIPNARSAERTSDLAIIMYQGTLYICACTCHYAISPDRAPDPWTLWY